ncbi:effector protein pipB2 [Salmonella enterica subsp. enterica]|nr:effector protein pipB2 [Salmonella enterica subsp. enterica]
MNLKGAVLTGANLTAENLCGADLSDADLGGQYCLWRIVTVQILRAQIYREHH